MMWSKWRFGVWVVLFAGITWSVGIKIGGKLPLGTDTKHVVELGKYAAKNINESKLLKCLDASRQYFSYYTLTIEKCRPRETQFQTCNVTIYEQRSANSRILETQHCTGNRPLPCQCQCRKDGIPVRPCEYKEKTCGSTG